MAQVEFNLALSNTISRDLGACLGDPYNFLTSYGAGLAIPPLDLAIPHSTSDPHSVTHARSSARARGMSLKWTEGGPK